jgi:uncharacterized protein YceK
MRNIFVLLAVIVLAVSGCDDDINDMPSGEQTYYEQTHYNTLAIAGEQVWMRNYSTNRISQAHEKCTDIDNIITVLSAYFSNEGYEEIGSGGINKGKLSFTVNKPENLLEWDDLKVFFTTITEGEGWDVDINDDAIMGTLIEIITDTKYLLIREGLSGTTSSISDETVFFFYVDGDCVITGGAKEDDRVNYAFNPFSLKLKAGWNTIWYKQTYTTSGISSFSMDIKNPDLKWVLIPTVPTM